MGSAKFPPGEKRDREQHDDRNIGQDERDAPQQNEESNFVIGKLAADLARRIGRSARRIRKDAAGDGKIDLRKPVEEEKQHTPKCKEHDERGKRLAERCRSFWV